MAQPPFKPPTSTQRVFGRRKGRPLRLRKSRLMAELLPRLQINLLSNNTLIPATLFQGTPTAVWLEIGFGGGEHLVAQAGIHPNIGFIGCEPFVNGIASLLDHLEREQIANVRIFPDDARCLLDALPDAALDRVFILFADPWPKARHAERRFVGPENLKRLARVMKPGAELRLATDDANLKDWPAGVFAKTETFAAIAIADAPPAEWVRTRYEEKALKAGRQPRYFCYRRR